MNAKKLTHSVLLYILGVTVSVLPAAVAALCYFPIWVAKGGEVVVSGFTAFLLAIAALPLYKLLKKLLASPSSWVMWTIAFLLFLLLSRVAREMTVISFVGMISNIVAAIIFKIRERVTSGE